jgi:hypothetical protein
MNAQSRSAQDTRVRNDMTLRLLDSTSDSIASTLSAEIPADKSGHRTYHLFGYAYSHFRASKSECKDSSCVPGNRLKGATYRSTEKRLDD